MEKRFLGVEVPGMEKSDIMHYINIQLDRLSGLDFDKGCILERLVRGDYDVIDDISDIFVKERDCVRRLSVAFKLLEEEDLNNDEV